MYTWMMRFFALKYIISWLMVSMAPEGFIYFITCCIHLCDDWVLHPHHVTAKVNDLISVFFILLTATSTIFWQKLMAPEGILYFITCHESSCMMMGFFTPIMSWPKVMASLFVNSPVVARKNAHESMSSFLKDE